MHKMLFRKPTTCKCDGGYRANASHWVRLEYNGKSAHLKCLSCGWKWWSLRKYALKLRPHKEASYSGMTDEDILERLRNGSLRVDVHRATVDSVIENRSIKRLRVINRESNGSSYNFVEIRHKGKKKKIALHRLVWMAHNDSLVPDGFDVDHIRGKAAGDGIGNLRLLKSSFNRSLGKPTVDDGYLLF